MCYVKGKAEKGLAQVAITSLIHTSAQIRCSREPAKTKRVLSYENKKIKTVFSPVVTVVRRLYGDGSRFLADDLSFRWQFLFFALSFSPNHNELFLCP